MYQMPMRPSSTGRLRSSGAVRKCSSIDVEAGEHVAEVVGADGDHQREADGGVERVAAAHPVPELEHVGGVDAELPRPLRVGRHRDEVVLHRGVVAEACEQPVARGVGVGQRLDGRERLRRHDEQRLGGVEVVGRLPDVGAVDVRHEAHRRARGR